MCDFDGDFSDDGFMDEEPMDVGNLQDESTDDAESDDYYGPDVRDWMIIGPMSEEIAEEKRRKERIRRELFYNNGDLEI